MIVDIPIEYLHPHPQNPRRQLGDLTELAASIGQNGVMQNLTVVDLADKNDPVASGKYRVVIGHRRLAAARQAGLQRVPCAVAEMDERTQLATMLLENMQRSDLTLLEQAEGFQLMLDMGETVETVATQTGLSESTVRRRVKLMELDAAELEKSMERGGTLQDFMELEKIKDADLKNDVLKHVGTSSFDWKVRAALKEEDRRIKMAAAMETLETFAERVESVEGYHVVQRLYRWGNYVVEQPEDANERWYGYFVEGETLVLLCEEDDAEAAAEDAAGAKEREAALEARRQRREQLDEMARQAYALRRDFVAGYTGRKKDTKSAMAFAVQATLDVGYFDAEDACKVLGITWPEDEDEAETFNYRREMMRIFYADPERTLVVMAYGLWKDSPQGRYSDFEGRHQKSDELDALYQCLCDLGYLMSDEEKTLQNGSHPLFAPAQEGDDGQAEAV